MSGATWAIVLALVVASGVPLGLWACRRDPGPLACTCDTDRALLRLAKGEGRCPRNCITCRVITERAQENNR
ncbi:hypothetical protein F7R91_32700 [Streptomyces luteolifulvus]|uniref:Uncharacterized protein n=1 Tax=Streptomyces luteolifulvus TaxID=2615112 RepID=A0A6H9USJ2_9ACTN|nr:hypothetical protein [Streptomyces luteolifulvus]KAB1141387.1 hypothetical protein F7R91_32700 [Streptomyces luteolifulvus]